MFSVDIYFRHPSKMRYRTLLRLIGLVYLVLMGCSLESGKPELSDRAARTIGDSYNAGYFKLILDLSDVSSFDVYLEDDQTIHLIVSGKHIATDQETAIRYTRSEDGGHDWMDAVSIPHFPTVIGKRGNDIQLAAQGQHLVAIWQTSGEFPTMGPMVSAFSSDNGTTWNKGANPASDNGGNQAYIDLIADQQGVFHVIWLEDPEENGYQSLRYARSIDHGKHWSQPITLDDSTCSCCWNTFALSARNQLNVLYRDLVPRDMALMQSLDGGLTWKKNSAVGDFQWNFEGCPHIGGGLKSIGLNDRAQLHGVVWTGAEDKSGLYQLVSSNHGQSWSAPKKLGEMATNGDIAVLAGTDANTIAAIWNEIEPGGVNILLSKSADGGVSWSTPQRLSEAGLSPTHPKLIATGRKFLALWTEKNSSHTHRLVQYTFK